MKKLAVLLIALLILPAVVLAEEDEEKVIIGADSPFYGLKLFFEKIQLDLASGSEVQKAKLHLKFANKRVAEAKLAKEEKHRERALQGYDDEISAALDSVEKSEGIGQNVSEIVKNINSSVEKHIAVLELVKAKVREQAQAAIERNIERSRERVQTMETKRLETAQKKEEKELLKDMVGASRQETVREQTREQTQTKNASEQAEGKEQQVEKKEKVNAKSDIVVGNVIKEIEEAYEELNPAYNQSR